MNDEQVLQQLLKKQSGKCVCVCAWVCVCVCVCETENVRASVTRRENLPSNIPQSRYGEI